MRNPNLVLFGHGWLGALTFQIVCVSSICSIHAETGGALRTGERTTSSFSAPGGWAVGLTFHPESGRRNELVSRLDGEILEKRSGLGASPELWS